MDYLTQNENITPFIGQSELILDALEKTAKLATVKYPIIIQGERGTGKELIAERLHFLSSRWDQPFIKVNCAAVHSSLLESDLFGHEAGAFTDARRQRQGKFELANGGTLFLDEIAHASQAMQEKLLRAIEYGELERLGGTRRFQVDVRVVAASHQNLWDLAQKGPFRPDLLDRLAFDMIALPALRERAEDIRPLAEFFAMKVSSELGRDHFPGFSPAAVANLKSYDWPGNVRQLRNVIGRSVFHHDSHELLTQIRFLAQEQPPTSWHDPQRAEEAKPLTTSHSFNEAMDKLAIDLLTGALNQTEGNQTAAARQLGLTYHQFRGLMRKHKLLRPKQHRTWAPNHSDLPPLQPQA
jgi:psp operon transcriptional activator